LIIIYRKSTISKQLQATVRVNPAVHLILLVSAVTYKCGYFACDLLLMPLIVML